MHVAQFLDSLLLVVLEKIVIPCLPEGPLRAPHRHRELERVNHAGNRAFPRLAYQQMHVLGHDNIAGDHKPAAQPHALQSLLE